MIPGIPCSVCSEPGHRASKCPELNPPPPGEVNKEDAKHGQAGDDEDEHMHLKTSQEKIVEA